VTERTATGRPLAAGRDGVPPARLPSSPPSRRPRPVDAREDAREAARIEAIRSWRILDMPPESFGSTTLLAARVLDAPWAAVCVVDLVEVWFRAAQGLVLERIPRRPGLCDSVVEAGRPLLLPDARSDPASAAHPLVTGRLGLRRYAGVPLRAGDGHILGTLAVFDPVAGPVSDAQRDLLVELAAVVVRELEVRLAAVAEISTRRRETDSVRVRATNLRQGLGTHGLIGQAMGILMAQRGYDSRQAFAALREVSQRQNVKLVTVAGRLVAEFDSRMREREV
jgi:hypothetical protein